MKLYKVIGYWNKGDKITSYVVAKDPNEATDLGLDIMERIISIEPMATSDPEGIEDPLLISPTIKDIITVYKRI